MKVLVGHASACGSTKGIAQEIGDRLTHAGLQADVRPVDEVDTLAGYDAVVLGSAVHNMAWLPQAAASTPGPTRSPESSWPPCTKLPHSAIPIRFSPPLSDAWPSRGRSRGRPSVIASSRSPEPSA